MKPTLQIGTTGKRSIHVGPGTTITLGKAGGAETSTVFSTPAMINLMEHAARMALEPHLAVGEESVGIDVHVKHQSATPPKSQVTAIATVTAVEKNVVSFDVVAHDPWGEIGRGTHRRAVIRTADFANRLAKQKPPTLPSAAGNSIPALRSIQCHQRGAVVHVVLNRPEKRNAMNQETTADLEQLIRWLAANSDSARVLTISGNGNTFCAGDDVADLPTDSEESRLLSLRRGAIMRDLTSLPQVVIAAIDGLALGGGLMLAAASDIRIATHNAKFGLPECKLGWPPNYGMGILQSIIGRSYALDLALSGEPIRARRAQIIGLVNRIVPASQLQNEAAELGKKVAENSPHAIAAVKRLLSERWCDERATDEFLACLETETAKKNINRFR